MSPFSYFDHTADVGVEVSAESLEEVFVESGRALFSLIVDLEQLELNETETVELEGSDEVSLLIEWLAELIFLFDARGWLFREFQVTVNGRMGESGLRLTAQSRSMPQRLTPATEGGDQGIAEPRSTVVGRTDQDREPTPIGFEPRASV